MSTPQRVLICGQRSFAAGGLGESLRRHGHTVVEFSRGKLCRCGDTVAGPVDQLHLNPHLGEPFDAVVNFIVLKDQDIAHNEQYLGSLLQLCRDRSVRHLIHISSLSVYDGAVRRVDESAPIESDPTRKGAYGSLKVAADQFLLKSAPAELKVSFVRPGFILGPGLVDPIVGMALRGPGNRLLLLGDANNQVPLVRRGDVHRVIARLVASAPQGDREAFILCDAASPTRRQWLQACCELAGCGTKVVSFPTPLWRIAGFGGECAARLARVAIRPNRMIRNACRRQRFDPAATQRSLGIDFSLDFKAALLESLHDQKWNFHLPYRRIDWRGIDARRVTFIGFGGIVRQKHLPALRRLNFAGQIDAYDLASRRDESGVEVRAIDGARLDASDLFVVASPPQSHSSALAPLQRAAGPILVEKPLCYSPDELNQWEQFAAHRPHGVFVCHNFRFKANVEAMLHHLSHYNPGKLHHVDVLFQSPPVAKDWRPWARNERRSRTLLMDYAIHFLDVACMMHPGPWVIGDVRNERDQAGQTALIEGRVGCEDYRVSFLLRQGFIPRQARVRYTFQNYSVTLGFFPETFVAAMSDEGAWRHAAEKRSARRATLRKIADKLTGQDSDRSHAAAYLAASGADPTLGSSIRVGRLGGFYRMLFELAETVYGRAGSEA